MRLKSDAASSVPTIASCFAIMIAASAMRPVAAMPARGAHNTLATKENSPSVIPANAGIQPAADNQLTAKEKQQGWLLLFDGTTHTGWMTSSKTPSKTPVEDGSINPHKSGGYMMIHEKTWENFILSCDFKISKGCNSGIFLRTFPLEPKPGRDVGFNGLEIAVDDTTTSSYHDTGALYDLAQPSKNAMKPAGEWNHIEVTCDKNVITVVLNGEKVTRVDLDQFTEPNVRPDGSKHKFPEAFKDHPRRGYIGLQDHGSPCWYKNIKLRPLR